MSFHNLLNQFLGHGSSGGNHAAASQGAGMMGNGLPAGLVGGAAAGGVIALLMGNKKARKYAGTAAKFGGAAVLGGLAYKAISNYRNQSQAAHPAGVAPAPTAHAATPQVSTPPPEYLPSQSGAGHELELTLVKAMVGAAKADGHIDATEQQNIFDAVDKMDLDVSAKGAIFDLLQRDLTPRDIASTVTSLEHKSEVYLAARLAIDPDQPSEQQFLSDLARELQLPNGLPEHLESQVAGLAH